MDATYHRLSADFTSDQSLRMIDTKIYILLGLVAVQYHWILDESVLYLSESEGRAKYKQDESPALHLIPEYLSGIPN